MAGPGVDVCGVGTRCIKQMPGEYRCQADKQVRIKFNWKIIQDVFKDYKYDYTSYSSDDYYGDLGDILSFL